MFGWFKKKNVVPETKVLSEEDLLKESIQSKCHLLFWRFCDNIKVVTDMCLSDTRYKIVLEDSILNFYIVNEKGEMKLIAGCSEFGVYHDVGIWSKSFNSVLDDLVEKCKVLQQKLYEKEKMEKKIKEESFTKLFQEEI